MNLPIIAVLLADEAHYELPVAAHWYGLAVGGVLLLSLLATLAFASKGRSPVAAENLEH